MASRLEPGWRFSTLYLVKDSLGVMLEAAGLAEDALREFFELEATYLESAAAGGGTSGHEPGMPPERYRCRAFRASDTRQPCMPMCQTPHAAQRLWGHSSPRCLMQHPVRSVATTCCGLTEARHDGADSAVLLRATWRDTRRAVLRAGGVADFTFRQYLFACQARVLLRLGRPQEVSRAMSASRVQLRLLCLQSRPRSEGSAQSGPGWRGSQWATRSVFQVAERGLAFVKAFSDTLAAQQTAGSVPPLFREAWAFSACTALAHATLAQCGSHSSSHAGARQPQ